MSGYLRGSEDADLHQDLRDKEIAAKSRHYEPANSTDFIDAVSGELRDKEAKFQEFCQTFAVIRNKFKASFIGLKRLEVLVSSRHRITYNNLREENSRMLSHSKSLGYLVERCRNLLKDTVTVTQLVGETLKDPLADRHKKIAMQQELGLRLQDLDDQFSQSEKALNSLVCKQDAFQTKIEDLLAQVGAKVVPETSSDLSKEDQLKDNIFQARQDLLQNQPDPVADVSLQGLRGLGQTTSFFDSFSGKALLLTMGLGLGYFVTQKLL